MKTAFLSSTAKDLSKYRDAAYKAIEGLDDWHCVRMEDFGARDAMADEFCQEKVAKCDVFVGIVGHCYGSSPKGSEKSYTEQEYDAALATDKPRLMFLAPENFPLPAHLIESDERRAKQRAFRDRANAERIRDTFTSPENLAWKVVQAIRNWEQKQAALGRLAKLEELDRASRARCIMRWQAAGVSRAEAAKLADDPFVGAPGPELQPRGDQQILLLIGEIGAGKSLIAERFLQGAIIEARENAGARVPVYLEARLAVGRLLEAVEAAASGLGNPRIQGATVIIDGADEAGSGPAAELLNEARVLVGTWPSTTVVITSRPIPSLSRWKIISRGGPHAADSRAREPNGTNSFRLYRDDGF